MGGPAQSASKTHDQPASPRSVSLRIVVVCGLVLSLMLAAGLSYYASSHPDGLEYVAEQVGFIDTADESSTAGSPLADYQAQGVDDERFSSGLAGIVGITVTGAIAYLLFWVLRRRDRS
ncbi:MAG: PDGLE domain-containing protein [Ornithinimicrobium sp.]